MRKFTLALFVAVVYLIVLAATSYAATVPVDLRDSFFSPQTITINVGDTVTWTNRGVLAHTTTSGSDCRPDGKWDSLDLGLGQSFSHTFTQPGTFPYFCSIHCAFGMVGTVTVNAPSGSIGGDVGVKSYTVDAATPLTLELNVTDNGVNPPAGVAQEWLVFGAIVNGVQTPFFFFTQSGQIVALSNTTEPTAVEFKFDHAAPVQTLTTNFVLSRLGFLAGDTFFYLYAWSPTLVTSFSNAPDLKFNNVVIATVGQ